MIRCITDETFPFSSEMDSGDTQTVFHVRRLFGMRMAEVQSIFEKSKNKNKKTGRYDDTATDPIKIHDANVQAFLLMVESVDNIVLAKDHPRYEDGKLHSGIRDPDLLRDVAATLPASIIGEIFTAASDESSMSGVEEKKIRTSDVDSTVGSN